MNRPLSYNLAGNIPPFPVNMLFCCQILMQNPCFSGVFLVAGCNVSHVTTCLMCSPSLNKLILLYCVLLFLSTFHYLHLFCMHCFSIPSKSSITVRGNESWYLGLNFQSVWSIFLWVCCYSCKYKKFCSFS